MQPALGPGSLLRAIPPTATTVPGTRPHRRPSNGVRPRWHPTRPAPKQRLAFAGKGLPDARGRCRRGGHPVHPNPPATPHPRHCRPGKCPAMHTVRSSASRPDRPRIDARAHTAHHRLPPTPPVPAEAPTGPGLLRPATKPPHRLLAPARVVGRPDHLPKLPRPAQTARPTTPRQRAAWCRAREAQGLSHAVASADGTAPQEPGAQRQRRQQHHRHHQVRRLQRCRPSNPYPVAYLGQR